MALCLMFAVSLLMVGCGSTDQRTDQTVLSPGSVPSETKSPNERTDEVRRETAMTKVWELQDVQTLKQQMGDRLRLRETDYSTDYFEFVLYEDRPTHAATIDRYRVYKRSGEVQKYHLSRDQWVIVRWTLIPRPVGNAYQTSKLTSQPYLCAEIAHESGLELGREITHVLALLGQPDQRQVPRAVEEVWRYADKGVSVTLIVGKVDQIVLTKGKLNIGIGIGDTTDKLMELLGPADKTASGTYEWTHQNCASRLSVKVLNDRVTEIAMASDL
jgi:hypothetical protein